MGEVKIETEFRNNPQLQKLARALLSIARRQLAATETDAAEVQPPAGKDAA